MITKDAKSDEGVFMVHTIKDKVYYEIPRSELNKEFLWISQIARTTLGVGYGGQAAGNRVVRWERKGNRILLRNIVIAAALPRTTDRQTRAHLADARDQIAKALDPKFAAPAPVAPQNPFGFDDEFNLNTCWPDYAIRVTSRKG